MALVDFILHLVDVFARISNGEIHPQETLIMKTLETQMRVLEEYLIEELNQFEEDTVERSLDDEMMHGDINNKYDVLYQTVDILKATNLRCAICLQDMEGGEYAGSLPKCNHIFHGKCIAKWLNNNSSCPLCRSKPNKS